MPRIHPHRKNVSISSIGFSPSTATAGETVTVTVTLTHPAQDGGETVELNSDNAGFNLPDTIVVPQGETTASFVVTVAQDLDPSSVASVTGYASVADTTVSGVLTTSSLHSWQPNTVALSFDTSA